MNITKKSILGVGQDTSLVNLNWLRPYTPNTKDGKEKIVDSVEFEINHKGIEKLERNINNKTEYIMCFVHFDTGTENLDGIYLSVWDDENSIDDNILSNILDEGEKKVLFNYALEELREYRKNIIKSKYGGNDVDRYDWIIGICCSETDGVKLYRFFGSKDEIKEELLSLIDEDRSNDAENWEYGSECPDDIQIEDNGLGYELYGYGCYGNYHIDYTAKEFAHVVTLLN